MYLKSKQAYAATLSGNETAKSITTASGGTSQPPPVGRKTSVGQKDTIESGNMKGKVTEPWRKVSGGQFGSFGATPVRKISNADAPARKISGAVPARKISNTNSPAAPIRKVSGAVPSARKISGATHPARKVSSTESVTQPGRKTSDASTNPASHGTSTKQGAEMKKPSPAIASEFVVTTAHREALPDRQYSQSAENSLFEAAANFQHAPVDNICSMCEQATTYLLDGFPCRVCGTIFHYECLKKSGRYSEQELEFVQRAKTYVGWSCERCDNIGGILKPHEVEKLADDFEKIDLDRDLVLSFEEYYTYLEDLNKTLTGQSITEVEKEAVKQHFRNIDVDGDGKITYIEYVKNKATKMLSLYEKDELVALLSPNEIAAARSRFDLFDTRGEGKLELHDVRNTYEKWYTKMEVAIMKRDGLRVSEFNGSSTVDHHVDTQSRMLFGDMYDEGVLTWENYLRSQALYILCSRPNKAVLPFKI